MQAETFEKELPKMIEELKRLKWSTRSVNTAKQALVFIKRLKKAGIPLNQINVNHWVDSSITVYVGNVSYGKLNRDYKKYYRFSDYDVKNAIAFYKNKGD